MQLTLAPKIFQNTPITRMNEHFQLLLLKWPYKRTGKTHLCKPYDTVTCLYDFPWTQNTRSIHTGHPNIGAHDQDCKYNISVSF